jgi:RNA polymerase sigma-70 factor (ECF subfamily)
MEMDILTIRRNEPLAASKEDKGDDACNMADFVDCVVTECRRGDREAQRQLYEHYHSRVHRLMVRMVGREDAADLSQQVFLRVLQTIHQFNGQSRFETWLYRVAVNEALQHLRRRSRKGAAPLEFEPADHAPSPTRHSEEAELLEQALARLDPELRSLFLLREVEQLSYREIASILDMNEGTVGSRLNRARELLQHRLTELGWRP